MPQLTRPWEVYLVHHTHVDIGYTEPQQVVMPKHADFMAQALDYCSATDHLPPGERFVWTCEVSWTVKVFLQRYPERTDEFFRRVRQGRIEITGVYLQLTDLFGEDLLSETLEYAVQLADEHGFEVVTGMQSDVNGWAWGLPNMMAERGIRYFDVSINETRSLGVRPRPHPFYWASPDGSSVLMWHGEPYLLGNCLDLDRPDGEEQLSAYLARLAENEYPHNATEIHIHGACHDNAPPGLWISDLVKAWNAAHDMVKLRLCTPRKWFEHLEANWPEPIPELRKGWPDWWADGHGSALYEVAAVRRAQADLSAARALRSAGASLDEAGYERAREAAMFFCEHTWGAWCSTDEPDALESKAGWNAKAGFAYTSAAEASRIVAEALKRIAPVPGDMAGIRVFNPLPFSRTDVVELVVEDVHVTGVRGGQVLAKTRTDEGPKFHLVAVDSGEHIPVERIPAISSSARWPAQRVRFVANDLAAMGWKHYRIVPEPLKSSTTVSLGDGCLENSFWRLRLDEVTGGIASLVDKSSGRELVAADAYTLNQLVFETIDSPEGREALCMWEGPRRDTTFSRSTPRPSIKPRNGAPFDAGFLVEWSTGAGPSVVSEITVYDDLPRIDITCTMARLPVDRAEAVYHAFPIASRAPEVYLDVPGAVLRPGVDQVPGSATDWHSIQRYFAVSDTDYTVTVASPDVPLVQVNGINTGKWQQELPPYNGVVMSWATNNYWFTNFPAMQWGKVSYGYSLSSYPESFSARLSSEFADRIRQPLVAAVVCRR